MKKKLRIISCLLVAQQMGAVMVLERDGKKHDMNVKSNQTCIAEQKLSNPHMPTVGFSAKSRTALTQTWAGQSLRAIFTDIYNENYWQGTESVSGKHASLAATRNMRHELHKLWDELRILSIFDAGCGDYYWMQTCDMKQRTYIGGDIVSAMIEKNRSYYADAQHCFLCLDISVDAIPRTDLILCRNVLDHVDARTACKILRNLKASGSTFLLLTTHIHDERNHTVQSGDYFPYNMTLPPFNLPAPLASIDDDALQKSNEGKQILGLWLLQDIDLSCLQY